ncbi:MAG: hypothetical protein AB7L90_07645 [Hyphomicrobiaceae bacterium]
MSAGMQLITIQKLVGSYSSEILGLKTEAVEIERRGLDADGVHARLSDAEAALDYLHEVLDALHVVVGGTRQQA